MPGQKKKSKEQFTLTLEALLLRAIEREAQRQRISRVEWITEAIKDKLESIGKLP